MFGNPGFVGDYNAEEGRVEEFRFQLGRDGRLRNDHPYISGVGILRERDLAYEYQEQWHSWCDDADRTRKALENL
jgi:hypothetical protein